MSKLSDEDREALDGMAARWDGTPDWHDPPFFDGKINVTTRHLFAAKNALGRVASLEAEVREARRIVLSLTTENHRERAARVDMEAEVKRLRRGIERARDASVDGQRQRPAFILDSLLNGEVAAGRPTLASTDAVDRWAAACRRAHWWEDDTLKSWDEFVRKSESNDGSEAELWRRVARAAIGALNNDPASAPTPEAPPSKSVQRRLAAQGAPTSAPACICPPGWVTEQGEHGNLCPARFYPTAAETDAAVSSIASIASQASAPTSGQGAAATATTAETPRMVCDLEGDDACACSTTGTCRCVAEPVCSGPLVGSLVEPEFECATCGAQMIAAPSPAARPPSDTCARCDGEALDAGEACPACVPASAAQPATETCGLCSGLGSMLGHPDGGQRRYEPCSRCGGTGTTPRKEGP